MERSVVLHSLALYHTLHWFSHGRHAAPPLPSLTLTRPNAPQGDRARTPGDQAAPCMPASPAPVSSSSDEDERNGGGGNGAHAEHARRRAATDPPPSLLAAAGAALAARRAAAVRAGRKAGRPAPRLGLTRPASAGAAGGGSRRGVGSVPGGRAAGARVALPALTATSTGDDSSAAAALRAWLDSLATAPASSRYARHKVAVVRTALKLLEAKR